MPSARTLVYRGPAPRVSMFAQMLQQEGVEVDYERPDEHRSAGEVGQMVVVYLVLRATDKVTDYAMDAAVDAAKAKWRQVTGKDAPVEDANE